ncbi:Las17-binding protein actin regulator-like protein 2 [Elsinoe fawcettii]|nr:Las17-binding protein actin regulator-like protein 2 [Elsinoe fawcettii]
MAAQQSSMWEKTKSGGKVGFNKIYALVDKLGPPVNRLSNKLGSEAFWPTTMDKECDKAARILKSFCKDGFYAEEERPSTDAPKGKQRVLMKIPAEVIKNAVGLAIFTTMRTGLWIGGSGGSGVLVARKADGSWSSPSGIQVQTLGLGFLVGVDIYDCILVINNQKALEAFTRVRTTIGGDLSVSAGPFGVGGMVESEVHKRQAPIFNYIKSRGFYAGVQVDGTLVIERNDENERFYGEKITAQDILKGKVRHPPYECRGLYETLKAAEGSNHDAALLPQEAPPSDFEIEREGHVFGVPDKDDPDPYGVLQLEKEGMVIKEAGTQKRASWEQFTFSPSVTSPVYDTFDRRSNRDSRSPAVSRRGSWMTNSQATTVFTNAGGERRSSRESLKTPVSMSNMGTQTDDLPPPPPPSPGRQSFRTSTHGSQRPSMDHIPENEVAPASPSTHSRSGSYLGRKRSAQSSLSQPSTPPTKTSISEDEAQVEEAAHASDQNDADAEDTNDEIDDEEPVVVEEPIVQTVQTAAAPKVLQKARMVTVPKRGPPPALPPRNPNRHSGPYVVNGDRPDSRASNTSGARSPATSRAVSPLPAEENPYASGQSSLDAYLNDIHTGPTTAEPSPGETPGLSPGETRDPWSGILAQHHSVNNSQQSLDVPGAFQSFPTTPADEKQQQAVKA